MNNNNIENNNGEDDEHQHQQQQAQAEQQQQQQDVIVDADAGNSNTARRTRRLKLAITVLERNEKFPLRNRNKIDELVETFLEELGDDIHSLLCDNDIDDGDYHGLDSDRDTEAEVETAIQLFPEVLTRRTKGWWSDIRQRMILGEYPIQRLAPSMVGCNVKAVLFIPIVARVAIELGVLFNVDQERGGLLCDDNASGNVLENLMLSDFTKRRERHEPADAKHLQALMQLREMGLLKKEDIQTYDLLHKSCSDCYYYFAENRFKFLVEWDPSALTQTCEDGRLPIHYAAEDSSIRGFQLVFEYGILYYPKKNGINILFRHKYDPDDNDGKTPFEIACEEFGYEQVMEVVEDTLIRYSSSSNNTPPLNIMEALITAAIDENIHLDCVYFLLRREPDVLMKLLSSTPPPPAMDNNNNSNNDDDGGNDGNSSVLVTRTMDSNKKRKRE